MRIEEARRLIQTLTVFARLRFPMESAEDVVRQLASAGATRMRLEDADVDLRAALGRVPAYYFPITSLENLLAKGRSILDANEHRIGVPREAAPALRRVARTLTYPVTSARQLEDAAARVGVTAVRVGGRSYPVGRILQSAAREALPIRDAHGLYRLARSLSRRRRGVADRRQR